MAYEFSEINNAFIKLKTYIYYDNTDILLRKQLVEFETNRTKDINSLFGASPIPYKLRDIFTIGKKIPVEEKLTVLTEMLNNYDSSEEAKEFFDYLFSKVDVNFFPKKIKAVKNEDDSNFITNVRVEKNYELERVTSFLNAPIEFHILSVLWIMNEGYSLDSKLSNSCYGNRLLLNGDNDKVVQGSGLFKPYYNQYQNWRDDSVTTATELLQKKKNVLFINLDIKDYFHSVRMEVDEVFKNNGVNNLNDLMRRFHINYTLLVSDKYEVPNKFSNEVIGKNNTINKIILPIGLLSSYVLANEYLSDFDKQIQHKIKPAYYGRYVDDILMVISPSELLDEDDNLIENQNNEYSKTEKIISEIFNPIIKVKKDSDNANIFKLETYESLFCQSSKSLVYYFKHSESTLVIDKLKKELDERSSEFRDIPLDSGDDSFEKSAYHLLYDNSEGKVRTLKDYKEDRFGLTVYLSSKIYTALRQQKPLPIEEIDKILKFFKGETCIDFYRMWEKIFTLFLVNNNPKAYVDFYLHCVEQIDKISNFDKRKKHIQNTKVEHTYVSNTLIEYLDCAHEIVLSLNPNFLKKAKRVLTHFEFQCKKLESTSYTFFFSRFEPTNTKSFWLQRYRESNMVRDKYIVQPLLNYTKESKHGWTDLTSLNVDYSNYVLDDELIENSPRPIRFWECCLSFAFTSFGDLSANNSKDSEHSSILSFYTIENENEKPEKRFYLDKVFELYSKANKNHLPAYLFDENFKDSFFKYNIQEQTDEKELTVIELITRNNEKLISKPKIAFANTRIKESNIVDSLRNKPNISKKRYQEFASILKKARIEQTDMLLFPEFFIPINLLSSLVRFSERNQVQSITGLEHITINNVAYNFIVSILPIEVNGIKDAVIVFRLKNHYAHIEELMIEGNHFIVPKPVPMRYDIINWNNIYFSPYYCFELANVYHRSLMKSKIDLMIGVEWNKDTPYFSNIVEATSRDIHAYFAQVNTSQYGDTRLTQPSKSAVKDLLRLKGGENDAILVSEINIDKLREFQRTKFSFSRNSIDYKPLPPDFNVQNVINRIKNKSVL